MSKVSTDVSDPHPTEDIYKRMAEDIDKVLLSAGYTLAEIRPGDSLRMVKTPRKVAKSLVLMMAYSG